MGIIIIERTISDNDIFIAFNSIWQLANSFFNLSTSFRNEFSE
jgi:hypothetical protein